MNNIDFLKVNRALISVSDKRELLPLARTLANLGIEIISTGGTKFYLMEQNIKVTDVSEYTGFPEKSCGNA